MSNPLGNIMKQAQKMQEKMAEIQKGLASKTCEASAGGGMVTATEDLIVAAVSEAFKRTQQMVSEEMASVTAGLGINLPGL
jgi:DNA-binding protein YbaB